MTNPTNNMKQITFIILVFVALVKASDWKEKARHMQEQYENAREKCTVKLGLTDEEAKAMDTMEHPETRTQKCAVECILTETGMMQNGKYSRPGSDKISEYLYEDDPQYLSLSLTVSRRCEKELAKLKIDDGCEMASETLECLRKNSKQLGIKSETDY